MKRGFTLIELVVSTGIIAMMLSVSLPAFLDFQKRQNLNSSAQVVLDAILEANNYALAPRSTDAGERTSGTDYYRVDFFHAIDLQHSGTYTVDEQSGVGSDVTNVRQATWTTIKNGQLAQDVDFCGSITPTRSTMYVIDPQISPLLSPNGIIYSISRAGRIVDPTTQSGQSQDLYGMISIFIKHRSLNEARRIDIQAETGQVSITSVPVSQCPG